MPLDRFETSQFTYNNLTPSGANCALRKQAGEGIINLSVNHLNRIGLCLRSERRRPEKEHHMRTIRKITAVLAALVMLTGLTVCRAWADSALEVRVERAEGTYTVALVTGEEMNFGP